MLADKAVWNPMQYDMDLINDLITETDLNPLTIRILVARGLDTAEKISKFLYVDKNNCHNPFLLRDMDKAVKRIKEAIENKERLRIYGDYDADGVSSTSLMIILMRKLGANFDYYIPHREDDGYGLHSHLIDNAHENGIKLIITVDTGISAVVPIAHANSLGIDVIVTDHHEPPDILPDACAIVNPKRKDCPYPFKGLAGVGVAFKLAHALLGEFPEDLLQFATIGTVADLMPLTDENRTIVTLGLKQMSTDPIIGMKSLLKVSGITGEVKSENIGFGIGPRINACGRLASADDAVRLLVSLDQAEADELAESLNQINKERQEIVKESVEQAVDMLKDMKIDQIVVIYKEEWKAGVVGLIASKVVELYSRPTIVLCKDPKSNKIKGSARSYAGFNMFNGLKECVDLLSHFGGHAAAAGMALELSNLDAFRNKLNAIAKRQGILDNHVIKITSDVTCDFGDLNTELFQALDILEPVGQGNEPYNLIIENLPIRSVDRLGKTKEHLKIICVNDDTMNTLEIIGWGRGSLVDVISTTSKLDVIGKLTLNTFRGANNLQVVLTGIKIDHVQVFDLRKTDYIPTSIHGVGFINGVDELSLVKDTEQLICDYESMTMLVNSRQEFDHRSIEEITLVSCPNNLDMLITTINKLPNLKRIYCIMKGTDISALSHTYFNKMNSHKLTEWLQARI
jgi:single-stranded-DNA-specific exonuclease